MPGVHTLYYLLTLTVNRASDMMEFTHMIRVHYGTKVKGFCGYS